MTKITHFTHPNCILTRTCQQSFICNGCGVAGYGVSYRCDRCDFDLHENCAKCPQSLSCSMHSHCLTLTQSGGCGRWCSVCCQATSGLVYECGPCGFVAHPLCVQGRSW
ncbi:protein VACUOLELESS GAMETOPHYTES-like [Musa acuminata AAA Group]|uniref:protein VACUOLELESS GAMETOPHYTES-like n=1 Tax=Musa acuminata AAA Group TaxID=214697 RepID=UPI0031D1C276